VEEEVIAAELLAERQVDAPLVDIIIPPDQAALADEAIVRWLISLFDDEDR
jgi:hypothetical protein